MEVWQIKAFADLSANQAKGSNILEKVLPHFERADRLYTAALALQDEEIIRQDYARLLRRWGEILRLDSNIAASAELDARADKIYRMAQD